MRPQSSFSVITSNTKLTFLTITSFLFFLCYIYLSSGRSKGEHEGRTPPGVQILSVSCSFLGKFGAPPLGSWRPLIREILDPPLLSQSKLCWKMLLNLLINYYVSTELICQDKYTKI